MIRRTSLVAALGALVLSSCSGSSSGGTNFVIQACSLGCSRTGDQVNCGVTAVAVNQEIRIRFNSPINVSSATNSSFRMIEVGTGLTPPGRFRVDPNDNRTLIYQPELSFDSSGAPIFGLTQDETYNLFIPGTRLDPAGPYLQDMGGNPVETRMKCTLVANQGILDPKPGAPRVAVTIQVIDDTDPMNPVIIEDTLPQGPFDAFQGTTLRMDFDDIINPATLLDPVTGTSNFIQVLVDPDGNPTTTGDQLSILGTFTLQIDNDALTTRATFIPDAPLPSKGNAALPRLIILRLAPGITDLGGNPLQNGGDYVIEPQLVIFPTQDLTEGFDDTFGEDGPHSGAQWANNSRLLPGTGGGSGRLGDFVVAAGQTVTLDTDSENFAAINNEEIFDPNSVIGSVGAPTIVGGVFDFATLRVEGGGLLRFTGSNPARILVRGEAQIQGEIDISGASAPSHDSSSDAGGLGAVGAVGGGSGGDGGMRPDGSAFVSVGGVAVVPPPTLYTDVDGKVGGGIPVPNTIMPTGTGAAGGGGMAWPQPPTINPADPSMRMHGFPVDLMDVGGISWDHSQSCLSVIPGSPGGGGAHGLSGLPGVTGNDWQAIGSPFGEPTAASGGDRNELLAGGVTDPELKSLAPELGLLRGGAGGGGGGAHLMGTQNSGQLFPSLCFAASAMIDAYQSHSSAGGGAGGGSIQVQSGRSTLVAGQIYAYGGDGGGVGAAGMAQSGGGGAGGGILLQSPLVALSPIADRIEFNGGSGGAGVANSVGGMGAPGFVRIETALANLPDPNVIQAYMQPNASELLADFGVPITDVLTTAEWTGATNGSGALSGAQSCWIQPSGNFFELVFESDGASLGWDMTLEISGIANNQSYRGPNDIYPQPIQTTFGNVFDPTGDPLAAGAPVVVRFQGARAAGVIGDPCGVDLYGADADIVPGSLTAWVTHPDQLNALNPKPNMVRYVVIWDASKPGFNSIVGVHDLTIRVTPD